VLGVDSGINYDYGEITDVFSSFVCRPTGELGASRESYVWNGRLHLEYGARPEIEWKLRYVLGGRTGYSKRTPS
jgi:hypothetical protein